MVWGTLCAIILHRHSINGPGASRVRSSAYSDVDMIRTRECAVVGEGFKRKRNLEPALGVRVIIATGIGHKLSPNAGCTVDGRRISVERVEVRYPDQRVTGGIKDAQDVIDGFHHKTVASAQSLVRWLDGKLVAAIGKALLAEVQTIETQVELRVRLRLLAAVGRCSLAGAL